MRRARRRLDDAPVPKGRQPWRPLFSIIRCSRLSVVLDDDDGFHLRIVSTEKWLCRNRGAGFTLYAARHTLCAGRPVPVVYAFS